MKTWTPEIKAEIRSALLNAEHGQKRAVAEHIAERFDCSWQTIYRKAEINSKEYDRKKEIDEKLIDLVARIKADSAKMGANQRMLTTEDAIAELEAAGMVEKGLLTTTTVDRRLREAGFNQPRAYKRHEDDYVNQVHMMDFSRTEYFEIAGIQEGSYMVNVDGRRGVWNYKNKPKAERLRLWVVSYIDTFSRAQLLRYIPGTGENLLMVTKFLQFAWQREDGDHPFCHLPLEVLKLDQGAIGKSAAFRENMERHLNLRVELAAPKNDRLAGHQSMGKIERRFRSLWTKELKWAHALKMKGVKQITLEELNQLAHGYCIEQLEKKHPVRNATIGQVYRTGLRMNRQRRLKTDIFHILYTDDTRVVSATADISINNELYKVPEKYVLQKIHWHINADGEMVGTGPDKKDTFPLIPFDPAAEKGQKLHTPSYRELAGAMPPDLPAEKLNLTGQASKTMPDNVHTLGAESTNMKPETPFGAKQQEQVFEGWDLAKSYICESFGCRWDEMAEPTQHLFQEIFEFKKLSKQVVDDLSQTAS